MDNGVSSYQRFLAGDDNGFVEIIRDYKDGLMFYINSYVDNFSLAEELMEDTFFKIITKKPNFFGRSSFKTWLYAIGRNVALDYLRNSAKILKNSAQLQEMSLTETENVEQIYLREERRIIVHRALQKLNMDYRQVLYLSYFEELSNAEIAYIMRKSKRQIENLNYRAKQALKIELEKEDFVYEEL